jgi:hypothetical protein
MSHPGRHGGPRLQDFITEVGPWVDAGDDEVNLAFSQWSYAQEHTITWSGLTQKTGVVFKITNDFKELMDFRHF